MKRLQIGCTLLAMTLLVSAAQAAYLLEIDTDGMDDGVLTYHPGFSYGGDTTTASQSSPSSAFGMNGGDSIFGGDGTAEPDTYVYAYNPSAQADNLAVAPGTDLGEGNTASGRVGGGPGSYDVYATWPFTSNVSGGLTTFDAATAGDSFQEVLNQNDVDLIAPVPDGRGHVWVYLGSINYTSGDIVVSQSSGSNSFVSMRAAGMLFERTVPEPSSIVFACFAGFSALLTVRRR